MASETYAVTKEDMKIFSPQEIQEFKRMFRAFDLDGSGAIDATELKKVLNSLGENLSDADVQLMICEVDADESGTVSFTEFLTVMKGMRAPDSKRSSGRFERVVKKKAAMFAVEGSSGQHSFSETERASFSEHINNMLSGDAQVAHLLPLNPAENDLFRAVSDGTLLCKLVNCAVRDTIDLRAMNFPKAGRSLNVYQVTENQNLLLGAAKAIGCVIVNIGPQDLINGMKAPHLVLGLIWQIVKIQLLGEINLKAHPELVRLLDEDAGEELGELLKMPPEQVLMRWVNYHLSNAGSARRITNFGSDVKDGEIYATLLNQIQPEQCDLRPMAESDLQRRAVMIINSAKAIGVPCFIQPEDVVKGNPRMNLAFCAQIFNANPGLTITEAEAYEMAGLLDDDEGDSREERVFRTWVNSLAIPDLYVHNLFEDMKTGVVLLQLMDAIQPGIVSWRRVNRVCKNKFKKIENANYVVVLAKQLRLSMVNIGGVDIVDGNKKLILGIVWQLMRLYILKVLASLDESGRSVLEKDIIKWANVRVANRGGETKMDSFKDKSLKDGRFFLDLLSSIEPRAINWELVTPGASPEERENNAKYCLSVARKIGAVVFLTWEDITEVKPKMLLTFVASLWAATKTMQEQTHAGAGAGEA